MLDLTEDLLEFPCAFPVKAIGKGRDDFEALVVSILQRHVPDLAEDAVTSRPSRNGKYLAVTVTFTAESKEQLHGRYQALRDHDRVLMVF